MSQSRVATTLCDSMERFVLAAMQKSGSHNFFMSPFSTLLLFGCLPFLKSTDRMQLLQVLGLSSDTSDNDIVRALKEIVEAYKRNRGSTLYWCLALASSINLSLEMFEKVGIPIMRTSFPEPAVSEINRQVQAATLGLIKELLSSSDVGSDTQSVLVNAIAFKGGWVFPFMCNERMKWETPGCAPLERDFMRETMEVKFANNGRYRYVSLPFNEKKEMEFFISEDKSKLPLELSVEEMNEIRQRARVREVIVSIPRWELTSGVDLQAKVAEIHGLSTDNLPRMKQVAFIHVDENGVVAAAASAWAEDGIDDDKPPPQTFTANRPFLYAIRSRGVTEYMGYMHNLEGVENPPCAYA